MSERTGADVEAPYLWGLRDDRPDSEVRGYVFATHVSLLGPPEEWSRTIGCTVVALGPAAGGPAITATVPARCATSTTGGDEAVVERVARALHGYDLDQWDDAVAAARRAVAVVGSGASAATAEGEQVDRVRTLHARQERESSGPLTTVDGEVLAVGASARTTCASCQTAWPCATVRVLDAPGAVDVQAIDPA